MPWVLGTKHPFYLLLSYFRDSNSTIVITSFMKMTQDSKIKICYGWLLQAFEDQRHTLYLPVVDRHKFAISHCFP